MPPAQLKCSGMRGENTWKSKSNCSPSLCGRKTLNTNTATGMALSWKISPRLAASITCTRSRTPTPSSKTSTRMSRS